VSRDGITASPDKVEAVRKYPVPKNARDVRSFLGLASFYRRIVPKFAEIAKPLTELTKNDVWFKWEGRQQAAFEKLKEILCSEQVLAYPYFNSVYFDDRCVEGCRGGNIITGARWCRTSDRLCELPDEQGRTELHGVRGGDASTDMGNKAL
jgi:hypothetical protein